MQTKHVPSIGPRYWTALCIASVFGANMGDYFAKNLGLGHVNGLPILAAMIAIVFVIEKYDKYVHQAYYWLSIIIVRTAATNLADYFAGDLKLSRALVMLGLAILLVATVLTGRKFSVKPASEPSPGEATGMPATDSFFWTSMLVAGTLGTVIGDFSSFGTGLGAGNASILLCVLLGAWFYFGRGSLQIVALYWSSIVFVRTAGTAVGDFLAGRTLGLGLPLSTLSTGILFVLVLALWKQKRGPI